MRTASRWDRAEFMEPEPTVFRFKVRLHCDHCDGSTAMELHGTDDADGQEVRRRLLLDHARAARWSVDGDSHRCPACRAVQLAEGTAPERPER